MPTRAGRLLRLFALLAVVVIGLGVLPIGYVAWRATESSSRPADAAVVLGAAVFTDRPSPVLVERVRHAVELYRQGQVRWLVMTGGTAAGDTLSEAEAARDWAVAQGVPAERVLVETQSRTTIENLQNVQPLLAEHGIDAVLIVSDPLHMARAMWIAVRIGLDAAPSPTPTSRFRTWRSEAPMLLGEAWFLLRYATMGT